MTVPFVVSLGFVAHDHAEHRNPWDAQRDERDLVDLDQLVRRALLAERAGFAAVFCADFLGVNRAALERAPLAPYEPITILSALAATTRRIGLVGTVSTQFTEPYNAARYLASLTQISRGRVGWNVVTSFNGERNFGSGKLPAPEERYERADEFVAVVSALWDSWKPGYLAGDAVARRQVDSARVVDIDHIGRHFHVEEALDIPLAPYEHPVLFQAGASDVGIDFAGAHAEAIFVATPTEDAARVYGERLDRAARRHGRSRSDIAVLPGVRVYIGETREEALEERNAPVTDADLVRHLAFLAYEHPDFGFAGLALDDRIAPERVPSVEAITASGRRHSRALLYRDLALRPGVTLREFLLDVALSFAHLDLVGTPATIADAIVRWYDSGLADGFTVLGGSSLERFADEVIPLVDARTGSDRSGSSSASLRDRLRRPPLSAAEEGAG